MPPASGRLLDAALAEFNALRAEITGAQSAQSTLVGVGLAAIGVIFGVVFRDRNPDIRLAYAIPFISFAVSALHASYEYRITRIGTYIRHALWPTVQSQVGPSLPSWEDQRFPVRSARPVVVFFDFLIPLLFGVASVLATVLTWNARSVLSWTGIVLTLATTLTPAAVAVLYYQLQRAYAAQSAVGR